ncbi:MAG: hypothetical protein Q8M31_21890 [Beijerinckiaceae bacterium]|nr:hypothetical protein [Beijerinckiaceae bacterium]
MTTDNSTPRPWKTSLPDETLIHAEDGSQVAITFQGDDDYEANYMRLSADAELIVRAVNAHGDMLAALKDMFFNSLHGNGLDAHHKARDRARAAIAKAEGRADG